MRRFKTLLAAAGLYGAFLLPAGAQQAAPAWLVDIDTNDFTSFVLGVDGRGRTNTLQSLVDGLSGYLATGIVADLSVDTNGWVTLNPTTAVMQAVFNWIDANWPSGVTGAGSVGVDTNGWVVLDPTNETVQATLNDLDVWLAGSKDYLLAERTTDILYNPIGVRATVPNYDSFSGPLTSGFSAVSGVFTVPETGVYNFSGAYHFTDATWAEELGDLSLILSVNDSDIFFHQGNALLSGAASGAATLYLTNGARAWLKYAGDKGFGSDRTHITYVRFNITKLGGTP